MMTLQVFYRPQFPPAHIPPTGSHRPAILSEAGQLVQQPGHAALHPAEVPVDVLGAVGGADEGLVVGEGQLPGLLQDLSPLLRQPLRLPAQLLHPEGAELRQVGREVRVVPPAVREAVLKDGRQDALILHVHRRHVYRCRFTESRFTN